MRAGALRPLGFFLTMLGFGLRLDTTWQRLGVVLLVAGGAAAAVGLLRRGGAFVPPEGGR
jgi:hypothetical protein